MPTYQYACTECGHSFEQFQSFSDDALTVCPVCDGKLRKLFNAVGVVFKGSGFYRNDSRSTTSSSEPAAASSVLEHVLVLGLVVLLELDVRHSSKSTSTTTKSSSSSSSD